jgi:carbon monoxide dehydrogenase subunit G
MKIEGMHELKAPRSAAYSAMIDPAVLARTIPGCEKLEQTGDNTYAVSLRAGVGSIKGLFTGNVRLEEMRAPEHYRIVVDGKGQPGFLKGSGTIDLVERDGMTEIKYLGDVQVGGTIAGVGQRMIEGAAKTLASQFFTAIESETRSE